MLQGSWLAFRQPSYLSRYFSALSISNGALQGTSGQQTSSSSYAAQGLTHWTAGPQTGSLSQQLQVIPQYQNIKYYCAQAASTGQKPKVVIVGSGWSSMTFCKALPLDASKKYDITVVSPRNYFLYTPLLPAVASGTCEERSIVEPVRNIIHGKGVYYEAAVTDVDVNAKKVIVSPVKAGIKDDSSATFDLNYDVLVLGVGSVNTTFGIPGVQDHCMFFKSIEDANRLRQRVGECFEKANLPTTGEREKQSLLTFVVVGGGPTGVEVAAELYDIVHDDLKRLYPELTKLVKICVVEMLPRVLAMYSNEVSEYTQNQFHTSGIQLYTGHRVNMINSENVIIENKEGEVSEIPYGACVWATGVAKNPLVKSIQDSVPEAGQHFRSLMVDEHMRLLGGKGALWVLGDASMIMKDRASDMSNELFAQADINKDGKLQLKELQDILILAAQKYHHLDEHAQFLAKEPAARRGTIMSNVIRKVFSSNNVASDNAPSAVLGDLSESSELTPEEFKALLQRMDQRISPLPPTAQVAWQQGAYLASLFAKQTVTGKEGDVVQETPRFEYNHRGSAAYVGMDRAVFDTPQFGAVTGVHAGWAWKGFETMQQISFRNRLHVAWDWFRVKVFGRDISKISR